LANLNCSVSRVAGAEKTRSLSTEGGIKQQC
jgi:hypothetical protein